MNGMSLCLVLCLVLVPVAAIGQTPGGEIVDFDSPRWEKTDAEITTHLGRKSLSGTAYLKDTDFENGVIEVDIAVDGSSAYPGIVFRRQSEKDYEWFYVRPHRAGRYPDALQYTPVFNGNAGWQLYHGAGFTAGGEIPVDQWVRLRMEIHGTQARVFVGSSEKPALVITRLKHGESHGTIGITGPGGNRCVFSNFRYESRDDLEFDSPRVSSPVKGSIGTWEISRSFKTNRVNPRQYPRFFTVFLADWKTVESEPSGLVDVSRYIERKGQGPDCVLARKIVQCETRRDIRLTFGYSDEVTVFLNGTRVFAGNSAYRSRDRSFLGVVGPHDHVYLTLEKGRNEIMFIVSERFGGWGFMARVDDDLAEPRRSEGRLAEVWMTEDRFKVPESVLFDGKRDILYVSNFNKLRGGDVDAGFISRVSRDGNIEQLEWITGLDGPCGMGIRKDRLYVVESSGTLVEIDIKKGLVSNEYPLEGTTFLNDLVIDKSGDIFISDTSREKDGNDIYRFRKGKFETWKTGYEIHRANGLFYHNGNIIVGNSGDGFLKSVSVDSERVDRITCLGAGVIDGIRVDEQGNYIVSQWEGRIYLVSPDGLVTEIIDTGKDGLNTADFEYIAEERLLVVPTFLGNKVVAYRLEVEPRG